MCSRQCPSGPAHRLYDRQLALSAQGAACDGGLGNWVVHPLGAFFSRWCRLPPSLPLLGPGGCHSHPQCGRTVGRSVLVPMS